MLKECCPTCGQAIMKHRQVFTKSLGDILLMAAIKHRPGEPFHLQRDLILTKAQYTNFQKLRYFGLVIKSRDGFGKRLPGCWELTGLARAFIHGKPIPKFKWTFNNEVVGVSEQFIKLEEAVGSYEVPAQWAEKAEAALVVQMKLL